MFNKLIKRIKSELKWRKQRREQAARAASTAAWLVLSGGLRKQP